MKDILALDGMDPISVSEEPDSIVIRVARRRKATDWCRHCGSMSVAPNGTRTVTYADLPIRGKPVSVVWERQRLKCRESACGKSSADINGHLHDDFMMTSRLHDWIGNRCLTHTFAAVAADVGLDERSVRRVFNHWADKRVAMLDCKTPKWLGMDEVHLLRSARGILTNIHARTLIDMLPNRSHDTMARRVSQLPNRQDIEVVAMDMWTPYRKIAANLVPYARVVIDKWHVTKYADAGMESVRKSFRAQLTAPQRRTLVKDRFLLLSRRSNLRPEQVLILESWTNRFPELLAAYEAKEAFYAIYRSHDRSSAEAAFDRWESGLDENTRKHFKELLSAMRNWREPIFNYFNARVTNAYTEAINGLVKIANRNGRGYSFEVLRARMLLARAQKADDRAVAAAGSGEGREYMSRFASSRRLPSMLGVDIATLTRMFDEGHFKPLSTEIAG